MNMVILESQIRAFESQVRQSIETIRRADSFISLARTAKLHPRPGPMIRHFPQIRRTTHTLGVAIADRASVLVENMKSDLVKVAAQQGLDALLKKSGEYHCDLQYLSGYAPVAVNNGIRAIQTARHTMQTISTESATPVPARHKPG